MAKNLESKLGGVNDARSGAMDRKLGTASEQEAALSAPGGIYAAKEELAKTQATGEKSMLDNLMSPEVLIKLGLAVAGGLSGNENLQSAGLGLGIGTLQGAGQWAQDDNAKRQKLIDTQTKQIDVLQGRLADMVKQQPGLFVDDDGQNMVPPGEWRNLLDLSVDISPSSLFAAKNRTKSNANLYDMAGKMLTVGMQTGNSDLIAEGLTNVSKAGKLDWDEKYIRELSVISQDQMITKLMEKNEMASVVAAVQYAKDNKVPLTDPGALSLLHKKIEVDKLKPSEQLTQDGMDALDAYDNWLNEDTDGKPNRLLHSQNPIQSMEIFWKNSPALEFPMKKVFGAAREGAELKKEVVTATMQATAQMKLMQLYSSDAFGPNSTVESRSKMMQEMASSNMVTINAAMGVVELGNTLGSGKIKGNQFLVDHNLDQSQANVVGADLISMAHSYALNSGMKYAHGSVEQRAAWDKQAYETYEKYMRVDPASIAEREAIRKANIAEQEAAKQALIDHPTPFINKPVFK